MEVCFEHVHRLVFRVGFIGANPSEEKGVGDCAGNLNLREGRAVCDTAGHGAIEWATE